MKASINNRLKKLEAYKKKRESKMHFISAHSDEDLEQQKAKYRAEHGEDPDVCFIMHWGGRDTEQANI